MERRRVLVPLERETDSAHVYDELTGAPVPFSTPGVDGHHPGDPPWAFWLVLLTDGGRGIELRLDGSPDDSGPCGVRYLGTARESDRRVEVRVDSETTRPPDVTSAACPDLAGPRTVTVPLSRPLGDRELYDATGRRLVPANG